MLALFNLFRSSTPTVEPIIIEGRRNLVVESYANLIKESTENTDTNFLQQAKRVFVFHRLPAEHPIHARVNAAIANSPLAAQRRHDTSQALRLKNRALTQPNNNSNTTFVQNAQTKKEVKEAIKAQGANWTEVDLNDVDDEMLELIASTCTQLTTVRIVLKSASMYEKLTDEGLQNIAKLSNLTTLELSIWGCINLSSTGLQQLFSQPTLQKNLTSITLVTYLVGNTLLGILGSYTNLQTFTTQTTSLTPPGIVAFLQSNTIKKTLQSFNVAMGPSWGTPFDSTVLVALAGVTNLNAVNLNGKWNAVDQDVLTFLKAKSSLPTLGISGYTISQPIIDQVATMTSLQSLTLADCSTVKQFGSMIYALTNLNTLFLGNAVAFMDNDLSNVAQMRNLTSLSLLGATTIYDGLEALTSSINMVYNLKSLYLSGCTNLPTKALCLLKKLANLTTLRLENINCFNDECIDAFVDHHSELKNTLQVLELNGVSVSNGSMSKYSSFKGLNTLLLLDCYALTKKGIAALFSDMKMQQQLLNLYLNGEDVDLTLIKGLNSFVNLQKLYLGNLTGFDQGPDSKDLKILWNLPNLKKVNTEIVVFAGELTSFNQFEQGLW